MSDVHLSDISLPCPFFEGHNTVYVFRSDPVTLIDTGVALDSTFEALQAGLREHRLEIGDIQRVILTHKHIDHIGNAWRIQRQGGAQIVIHENDADDVTDVDPDGERFLSLIFQRLHDWHVPADQLPERSSETLPQWQIEPANVKTVKDGQLIEMADGFMRVIHTPGHTMGSICLQHEQRLFTGDHILKKITPNVGGGDMDQRMLLKHYLDSLLRVRQLSDHVTALPGHGVPFDQLSERIDTLWGHHQSRLDEIAQILKAGPMSVFEVAGKLFGELADIHLVLGCAEAGAHLELLESQGVVVSEPPVYRLS